MKAGESLVRRHPPQPGKPGRAVTGGHLPARDGQDVSLRPGDNVELLEDGQTLRARIDGCVVLEENVLSVQDLYEVRGDVDYNTGNLDCNGILRVYGTVRSSFAARARSHVEVLGSVEDARVESGADIRITGGILMKGREEAGGAAAGGATTATRRVQKREAEVEADEVANKGLVTARGSVHAAFATNAMVNADEDIWIKNEAMNCNLSANGKVMAIEGKGAVIGGRVRASQGVEVRQLGSEAGIRTDVIIDVDPALRRQLKGIDEDFAKNTEEIEKINKMVKAGLLKNTDDISPKKKEAVVKLLKYYKGLKQAQDDLMGRRATIEEMVQKSKKAKVTVYGIIFPGVFLRIHDKQYKVDKEAKDYQFHWSETDDQIIRTPVLKGPAEKPRAP